MAGNESRRVRAQSSGGDFSAGVLRDDVSAGAASGGASSTEVQPFEVVDFRFPYKKMEYFLYPRQARDASETSGYVASFEIAVRGNMAERDLARFGRHFDNLLDGDPFENKNGILHQIERVTDANGEAYTILRVGVQFKECEGKQAENCEYLEEKIDGILSSPDVMMDPRTAEAIRREFTWLEGMKEYFANPMDHFPGFDYAISPEEMVRLEEEDRVVAARLQAAAEREAAERRHEPASGAGEGGVRGAAAEVASMQRPQIRHGVGASAASRETQAVEEATGVGGASTGLSTAVANSRAPQRGPVDGAGSSPGGGGFRPTGADADRARAREAAEALGLEGGGSPSSALEGCCAPLAAFFRSRSF